MSNKPANGLKKSTVVTPQTIVSALADAPEALFRAEKKRDVARAVYELRLAVISDITLNAPVDGQEKRLISNETQRKVAIDVAVMSDRDCRLLREEFEAAQREVNLCRTRNENYQLIARLILAQSKQ